MRKWLSGLVCGVLLVYAVPVAADTSNTTVGITVDPAMLELTLAQDERQAGATFDVTNHYQTPVTLDFSLEPNGDQGATISPDQLRSLVALGESRLVLQPGQTKRQSLMLTDGTQLPPGSQPVRLILTQQAGSTAGVTVAGRLVLPVTIVKQSGAIAGYEVTGTALTAALFRLPDHVTVRIRNTGNTVVVPHGVVTLADPNGAVVAQGVLNESSFALSRSGTLQLDTPIHRVYGAHLPGPYTVAVHYSPGGQTGARTFRVTRWYIAWWHAGLIVVLLGLGWYVRQFLRQRAARRSHARTKIRRVTAKGGSI